MAKCVECKAEVGCSCKLRGGKCATCIAKEKENAATVPKNQ